MCILQQNLTDHYDQFVEPPTTGNRLSGGPTPARGAEDRVDEVPPSVAGHVALQNVGLDVAERGLGLGRDSLGERLQDRLFETRPRMQGGDLGPLGVVEIVIADAEHVVLHTRGDQRHLRLHELGDAGGGVQGDRRPHPADAVFGHTALLQEAAGGIGAVHLEAPSAAAMLLVEPQVVEHRADVEQLRVETQVLSPPHQAAEEVDTA
ncbi:hypothetical protein GCM10027612_07890 [Microbispora bryophytorum subsp. camponoti]